MRVLDMTVAANVLGHAGDIDRERKVAAFELAEQLVDRGEVFADQRALYPALGSFAEDIERAAAQAAQFRQQLEGAEYPRPVFALAQLAFAVAAREQRRRKMEMQLEVAVELFADSLFEIA